MIIKETEKNDITLFPFWITHTNPDSVLREHAAFIAETTGWKKADDV